MESQLNSESVEKKIKLYEKRKKVVKIIKFCKKM